MAPALTDNAFPRIARTTLIGALSIAMAVVTLAGPVPAASAATNIVSSADALETALEEGLTPLELGRTFTYSEADLTVSADTTLLLGNYELTTKNIIVKPGVTLTIEAAVTQGPQGTLKVTADQGAGIETTNAELVINRGTISITSYGGNAGIGGKAGAAGFRGGHGGTTTINGGTVIVIGGGAGIGGGRGGEITGVKGGNGGDGGTTLITGGDVTVTGNYGAGIGGGLGGSGITTSGGSSGGQGGDGGQGGITTITAGTVHATGEGGAGIGGGAAATAYASSEAIPGVGGNGRTTTVTGGDVTATGDRGAGVGGGRGGDSFAYWGGAGGSGGVVEVGAGDLTAHGDGGAGVGGGDGGLAVTAGDLRVPGLGGTAAEFVVGAAGRVEASRSVTATPAIAVGPGLTGNVLYGDFVPMEINGELVLPSGQRLKVPNVGSVGTEGAGTITGTGLITGKGKIQNDGIITPHVHDDVKINGNVHIVTFDSGTSQVAPRTQTTRVLAPSFENSGRTIPILEIPENTFQGWSTTADGSGSVLKETTALSGNPTYYGQWKYDTYALSPAATAPAVGDSVTFEVEVEDGDPAGDQSGLFDFTTNAPGATFSGNDVTFTRPGDWTVTATHNTTPSIVVTAPITVTTDRTAANEIALSLSATTLEVDGTITATVTGTDAWHNPLGDLTDLARISSDRSGDTVIQGSVGTSASIHFATPGTRTITAEIAGVTDTANVTVTAEDYTLVADVTSPLAGDEVTFTITADDGDPGGNLAADFTFETTGHGATVIGNPITLTTAGDWTVTATHNTSGTQVTLPLTVDTDRTKPADISVNLSAFSVKVGGTITVTITGTDAWGNSLGDLTDLAHITSNHPTDVIGADGSIRFPSASTHVITADISAVSDSAFVTVIPAAAGGAGGLASTGADPGPFAALAVVLLLLGAALITVRRVVRSRR